MQWLVRMLLTSDGSEPDTYYSEGTIVDDRRGGAHDLVAKANDQWDTPPIIGEVYAITPVSEETRVVAVVDPGTYNDSPFGVVER